MLDAGMHSSEECLKKSPSVVVMGLSVFQKCPSRSPSAHQLFILPLEVNLLEINIAPVNLC